ncbi:MAG: DEAD/DEAH box helicase, partial [Chloroflexota bacterium]|nr:DEAD/DEAH box helicase [Chloroflexota bacterium]
IQTSRHAAKRCVLTGTPFPRTYGDGLTLFRLLYPEGDVLTPRERVQIRHAGERGDHAKARACLKPAIDGLFYRVRKRDLNLTEQVFEPPRRVTMRPVERELYECITKRISELEATRRHYDTDTLLRLRKGRQIRKRQATSFAALLGSAIEEVDYEEDLLIGADAYLREALRTYAETEVPGKITAVMDELGILQAKGEKVVVWSYFVGTLERIQQECDRQDIRGKTIWGGTPTGEDAGATGRAAIIQEFTDPTSGLDVLIANPAACAESISLHKTCGHAIYYDLSYNCAQYLQSLDRIHRVGGSETRTARYSFLMYEDTFEGEILHNLIGKAQRMADIVDTDFPLALQELPELEEMM